MDDISKANLLVPPAPVAEVKSRHSHAGEQRQADRRPSAYKPEPTQEDDMPVEDDDPHAVDEQA
jgi:hypothetical protein